MGAAPDSRAELKLVGDVRKDTDSFDEGVNWQIPRRIVPMRTGVSVSLPISAMAMTNADKRPNCAEETRLANNSTRKLATRASET